jgi:hypothetical protein
MGTQLKTVKLRPTNHYLDVLNNIRAKGGLVSDLHVEDSSSSGKMVSFAHSYEGSHVVIHEKILYNQNEQILDWEMNVNDSIYKLYEEN